MIKLSKRLAKIAALVPPADILCDVGCDHGYLPIELVKNGRCKRAYALDVREGPLSRAREHIREAGLSEQIVTVLSDGLDEMREPFDVLVIAGMGGPLMEDILTRGRALCEGARALVLSPQSHIRDFREFLCKSGYAIEDEAMVFEDGKYYFIMVAAPGGEPYELSEAELWYGPVLLSKREPLLFDYLDSEKRRLFSIREKLEKNPTQRQRLAQVEEELSMIENIYGDLRAPLVE